MSTINLANLSGLPVTQGVSRFSRAYASALDNAGLTKAQAAAAAGLDASMVSRLLNEERETDTEHVAMLLRAITDEADREHCIHEFLHDQCPPEYRERLSIHFGVVREQKPRNQDSLSQALTALEAAATDNPDLRKLIHNLAAMLGQ